MILKVLANSVLFILVSLSCLASERPLQGGVGQIKAETAQNYPRIVLFSTSWCPHCSEAKNYFARNKIPFINKDVESDSEAEKLLTEKYKSQGVPVIVIGEGKSEVIMKGFNSALFKESLRKSQSKK